MTQQALLVMFEEPVGLTVYSSQACVPQVSGFQDIRGRGFDSVTLEL